MLAVQQSPVVVNIEASEDSFVNYAKVAEVFFAFFLPLFFFSSLKSRGRFFFSNLV
jgi:hypothetical protein